MPPWKLAPRFAGRQARTITPSRLSQPTPHRISLLMRTTIALLAFAIAAPAAAQTTAHKPRRRKPRPPPPPPPRPRPRRSASSTTGSPPPTRKPGRPSATPSPARGPPRRPSPAAARWCSPSPSGPAAATRWRSAPASPIRQNAAVTVQVDQAGARFLHRQRYAFARDGKAPCAAFRKARQAVAALAGRREGRDRVDTFSLSGFTAAYAAIDKACPAH